MQILTHASSYSHHKHPHILAFLATLLNLNCAIEMSILNDRLLSVYRTCTSIFRKPILRIYQVLLGTYNFKSLLFHLRNYHTI